MAVSLLYLALLQDFQLSEQQQQRQQLRCCYCHLNDLYLCVSKLESFKVVKLHKVCRTSEYGWDGVCCIYG